MQSSESIIFHGPVVYHQAAQYHVSSPDIHEQQPKSYHTLQISHGSLRQPVFADSSQYTSSPQTAFYAAMEASRNLASLTQQFAPLGNGLGLSRRDIDVPSLETPHANYGQMLLTFERTRHAGLRLDLVLRGDMQGLEDPLSRDCFQGFGDKVSYKIPVSPPDSTQEPFTALTTLLFIHREVPG